MVVTRLLVYVTAVCVVAAFGYLAVRPWFPNTWQHGPSALVFFFWVVSVPLIARSMLWWGYRPLDPINDRDALPGLTVVIPAYNEGHTVRLAIESVVASDYPAERLRVVVVNDGSRDDTGDHMDATAAQHGERVTTIHLPKNQGKRHALHAGFAQVTTPLVATLDSDSCLPADSLRALVAPLVTDPRVAGVAGKVTADNRGRNILTRMLGVRYILGFDFVRAYQSRLGTVWCCPGALQCYRMGVIRPHLETWLNQRFLGAACTNGDDHAMTNKVLSLGHDTRYQSNAVVKTIVPWRYMPLCKMYTRWGRSATREGIRAMAFAARRAVAAGPLRGPLIIMDALLQPITVLGRVLALPIGIWLALTQPMTLLAGVGATTAVAILYCGIFMRSERSMAALWGIAYAWFAMTLLAWVQPFATLTVRRNGWMTRQ